jgi:hypothetical protein
MELFIQIENGQPVNHPALESNLIQALGEVPANWEKFVRPQQPIPTIYQVLESDAPVYAKVDGVWTDVWAIRDMTAEEKLARQVFVRDSFNAREQAANWSAWVLDEATCTMQPPIPRPDPVEGKIVFWCGADANWKEAPNRPEGNYKFDFFAWNWVAV